MVDVETPPEVDTVPAAEARRAARNELIRFCGVHVAAVVGTVVVGVTREAAILFVVMYVVRMFGVTAGYHRYFSHRTFKTSRTFRFLLALLAQTSAQKGPIWWARNHRHHHRYSDRPEDLHSPRERGLLEAHLGWLFNAENQVLYDNVRDLERAPELVWLDGRKMLPATLLGIASWLAFGWSGLFFGFLASTVVLWHGTFTINSLAHVFGSQRFDTGDTSRNNALLALITLGEGWHNNHHHDMRSCRQGLTWWEFDVTWWVLKGLERLGLVWDLRERKEAASSTAA